MNVAKFRGLLPVIISVITAVLIVTGLCRRHDGNAGGMAYEYVRPSGDTIAIGIEMSPLTYHFRNDTASGLDYEILRNIISSHGRVAVFHPVGELNEAFQKLYDGDYDLVVASMPSTTALKEYFSLTEPVYVDRQVLVQRVDNADTCGIASVVQLAGDTVWIVEGSPFRLRLHNLSRELGDSIHLMSSPGHSAENLAMMTALGQIPRAVVSEGAARRIAADYPNLDVSTPVALSHFQCWAVAPGDSELLDSLNSWLGYFKQTPEYQSLIEQYLNN